MFFFVFGLIFSLSNFFLPTVGVSYLLGGACTLKQQDKQQKGLASFLGLPNLWWCLVPLLAAGSSHCALGGGRFVPSLTPLPGVFWFSPTLIFQLLSLELIPNS